MLTELRKYPVIYKGKEYEVRWNKNDYSDRLNMLDIYEVTKVKVKFLFKFKEEMRYQKIYSYFEDGIISDLKWIIKESDQDFYIKEVERLFQLWERDQIRQERKLIEETNKQTALAEWNGVIE